VDHASKPEVDLTSTVHIASLRPVSESADAFDRLDNESKEIVKSLTPGLGMLVGISGPGKGARYLLDSDLVSIGRAVGSDIFLDDVTVSREHALIKRSRSGYEFEDRGSLNGSYIGGKLATKANLVDGDELQIGKFRVIFFIGGQR
jgi:pSer/pThr/pTyr-binding forkhead associated (FHA) protein